MQADGTKKAPVLPETFKSLETQCAEGEDALKNLQARYQMMERQCDEERSVKAGLQCEINEAKVSAARLQGVLEVWKDRAVAAETSYKGMQQAQDQLSEEIARLQREIAELRQEGQREQGEAGTAGTRSRALPHSFSELQRPSSTVNHDSPQNIGQNAVEFNPEDESEMGGRAGLRGPDQQMSTASAPEPTSRDWRIEELTRKHNMISQIEAKWSCTLADDIEGWDSSLGRDALKKLQDISMSTSFSDASDQLMKAMETRKAKCPGSRKAGLLKACDIQKAMEALKDKGLYTEGRKRRQESEPRGSGGKIVRTG